MIVTRRISPLTFQEIYRTVNILSDQVKLLYLPKSFAKLNYFLTMQKLAGYTQLRTLQLTFQNHQIYQAVNHQSKLRIFMQALVFTSWDFMILLKALQRRLTCVDRIWLPPVQESFWMRRPISTRMDIAIFLTSSGWFIDAMKEVKADTVPIQNFIHTLRQGGTVHDALNQGKIPVYVKEFVSNTVNSLDKPLPYVASQLFYGRENPSPQMFQRFVEVLPKDSSCQLFKSYLKRHVQVDSEEHGPLSQKLMNDIAARYDPTYELILAGAINSAEQAVKLWDGIDNDIKQSLFMFIQSKKHYT